MTKTMKNCISIITYVGNLSLYPIWITQHTSRKNVWLYVIVQNVPEEKISAHNKLQRKKRYRKPKQYPHADPIKKPI